MRYASVPDIWNELESGKGPKELYLKQLEFQNVSNIKSGKINFSYGITAICGANGVGKSTVLEAIGSVLNSRDFINKYNIFSDSKLELSLIYRGKEKKYSNEEDSLDIEFDSDPKLKYIQTGSSVNCITRFKKEDNVEEYLDSVEEEIFSKEDLQRISEIIGKKYEECKAYMIEEGSIYESMPFFIVRVNGEEYDTRNMGVGEHSVIYIYYYLKNMRNAIILLEEPENFIPPYSQINFIHLIGRVSIDNKLNIILTTHSNHILNEIPEGNIITLRTNLITKGIVINTVKQQDYLRPLGLQCDIKGYFLMEDFIAMVFCESIIKYLIPEIFNKYKFITVNGGCTEISRILKCYKSDEYDFNIIGVFDGDQNNEKKKKEFQVNEYQWDYTYLPYYEAIEDVFRELLNSKEGLLICDDLGINKDSFISVLSDTCMYEKHDWIHAIARELKVNINTLVDTMVKYLIKNKNEQFDEFITSIKSILCLQI